MTKTAIITGAARNIGKGITKVLLEKGYDCILLDKDGTTLKQTAQELSVYGHCQQYTLDIANLEGIDGFIDWLKKLDCDVSLLVNNVGYESEDSVQSLTTGEIKDSLAVNIAGPFYLTSQISNLMAESGNVVFITSTHSSVTRMHPLYSSSKAAVEMFMREAALELAAKKIRVNAIAPGPVMDTVDLQPSKYVPLGYCQQPKDVAEVVTFLVSNNARFITGQTIIVDGGFSIAHTHYWKNQNRL